MSSYVSLGSSPSASIDQFQALAKGKEHGEFRVNKQGDLYIANDGFFGRKVKSLDIGSGAKAERAAALDVFREALIEHCDTRDEALALFDKATAKHGDRLNVKDFDRVWADLHVAEPEPEPQASSSSKAPAKGYTPLHGREQVKAELASPEGVKATKKMETALAGVAKDERLLELIKDNKLSIAERMKQHGVASGKFYAGLVPFVGAGIKAADAHASSKELRALKSLRDDFAAQGDPQPLLSTCIDGLEDHNRVKRNKNAIASVLDVGVKVSTYATGGVAAPVAEAAGEAMSEFGAEAIGKVVGAVSSKVASLTATKGGQAHAERHVGQLQAKSEQVIGSGDQAVRMSDYHAVRALLIYLGPADQTEAIRSDDSINDEQRAKLLKQEESRLALKEMLGSSKDEDLTKGLERTDGDDQFIDQLATRKGKEKEGESYLPLRDVGGEDQPSPLRALWMLEGWIGTDNRLEQAVIAGREKASEAAEGVHDRVSPTRYHALQES
jgi:hypothetical protein